MSTSKLETDMTTKDLISVNIKKSVSRRISHRISTCASVTSCKSSVFQIKSKSHEELDIEIQSERILRVLDELIEKLQVVAVIPVLIKDNGKLLRKALSKQDADFVFETCIQCVAVDEEPDEMLGSEATSSYSASLRGSKRMSTPPLGQESQKIDLPKENPLRNNRFDANIQQAIAIICASEMIRKTAQDISNAEKDEISLQLIEGARRLRAVAVQRLDVSANEERERERELRKAWKENVEAKVLIGSIQEKLNKQKEELDVQLNAKDELINDYTEKIEILKGKFKEDIKKRINESEKSMIQKTQRSEETQTQLQQESKEIVHEYWTLLDQHSMSEKILRTKKIKIEAQLANWLAKYDQDIGEKQTEYEELQRLYEEEMEQLQALQKKFDEQEEEYIELMAERDEYERAIYEEKAYIFLTHRSARRIQRYWRAYRERKRLRKKARKGKKKEKGSASESGGADSAKPASGTGKKKGKKKDHDVLSKGDDPMAKLESKFKGDILEDISTEPIPAHPPADL